MRIEQFPDFNAMRVLHDTLHLHDHQKLKCGVYLCSCGAESDHTDVFMAPSLREEIYEEETRDEIVDKFGPELYIHLRTEHDMLHKAFKNRYPIEKHYIAQANDGSYHIKRRTPAQRVKRV